MNQSNSFITGRWEFQIIRLALRIRILIIAVFEYKNLREAIQALRHLIQFRQRFQNEYSVLKYAKSGSRYFLGPVIPGFPSKAFTEFIRNELRQRTTSVHDSHRIMTMIFTMTTKCSFRCVHCYEWEDLNKPEYLSLAELKKALKTFQDYGVSQVQLSGGEPLNRFDDLVALLSSASSDTEFRLLTSGFGLTPDRARVLKAAGLTGVNISLDSWDPDQHNIFRGNGESYRWVEKAVRNARSAGLQVCLSLCPVKEFITEENLFRYANLAREMGVGFIQILEPRATGHFQNQDVSISEDHYRILEQFYLNLNTNPEYRDYPIVAFPGYHQRKFGCYGAGIRYLYMDARGRIHSCPFCRTPVGNLMNKPLSTLMPVLQSRGCGQFQSSASVF
ncbi:MAG: radical SAM protein [FCB group bacterium]|nr:radical SAM protein [FCB group bacterium]